MTSYLYMCTLTHSQLVCLEWVLLGYRDLLDQLDHLDNLDIPDWLENQVCSGELGTTLLCCVYSW